MHPDASTPPSCHPDPSRAVPCRADPQTDHGFWLGHMGLGTNPYHPGTPAGAFEGTPQWSPLMGAGLANTASVNQWTDGNYPQALVERFQVRRRVGSGHAASRRAWLCRTPSGGAFWCRALASQCLVCDRCSRRRMLLVLPALEPNRPRGHSSERGCSGSCLSLLIHSLPPAPP
jgi:hypothetical protein